MRDSNPNQPEDSVLDALLRGGFAAGRARHGALELTLEVYAEHVLDVTRQRLARAGAPVNQTLCARELRAASLSDLFLATACAHGCQAAWERLASEFRHRLEALARSRGAARSQAEEVTQAILAELLLAPGRAGARTRLWSYDGGGTLFAWLAAILVRRLRAETSRETAHDGAERADPRPGCDPAEAAQIDESARLFTDALRAAWRELSDQERLALRAKHEMGLKQQQIALLLGVGDPRVSRIVQGALAKLRAHVDARLPGTSWGELLRAWSELRDRLGAQWATSVAEDPQPHDEAAPEGQTRDR